MTKEEIHSKKDLSPNGPTLSRHTLKDTMEGKDGNESK